MIAKLSRERVQHEIDQLDREVRALTNGVENEREKLPLELQEGLAELEESVILAKQFTSSNVMDFRRVELGLRDLRALKAEVLNYLHGYRI